MRNPPRRPFALADLMIVIAATAGAITLQRWVETPIDEAWASARSNGGWNSSNIPAFSWLGYFQLRGPSYYLAATAFALVLIRWRRPRPAARRTLQQPGAVACLAAAGSILLALALIGAEDSLRVSAPSASLYILRNSYAWGRAMWWTGPAVAGAWSGLALAGLWRAEPSWVDCLGRALGWYYLVVWLLAWSVGPLLDVWLPYNDPLSS